MLRNRGNWLHAAEFCVIYSKIDCIGGWPLLDISVKGYADTPEFLYFLRRRSVGACVRSLFKGGWFTKGLRVFVVAEAIVSMSGGKMTLNIGIGATLYIKACAKGYSCCHLYPGFRDCQGGAGWPVNPTLIEINALSTSSPSRIPGTSKRKMGIDARRKKIRDAEGKIDVRHSTNVSIARKMSSSTSSASGIMSAPAAKSVAAPKKVAKKEVAAPVAAPAPAPVVEAPKKAVAKKAVAAPAAAPVVVASTPVVEAVAAPAGPTTTLDEDLKAVTLNLNTLKETVSAMLAQVKKLDKRVHREIKDARKRKRRAAPVEGAEAKPRVLSIFERPTKVTEELLAFLGKPKDTLLSRSEVTKAVNNYVKEHNLKNKHDIKPDAALKKLLAIEDGTALTYFNLQKYLNHHYVKAPVATA